jgi:hypothetical protein
VVLVKAQKTMLASSRLLAGSAPVFFAAHVWEEAPGFVAWFNRLVDPDISRSLFLSVNAFAFVVTVAVAAVLWVSDESAGTLVALGWFGFLFLANGVFHVVATAIHGYSPGTITALCLYLPFFVVLFRHSLRRVTAGAAAIASLAGALPMAAHGYLIVFEGSRLF